MRSGVSLGGVAQVAEDVAGLQQVRLGGMVIAGFDRVLALLLELAGVEELLAFDGIGRGRCRARAPALSDTCLSVSTRSAGGAANAGST